MANIILTRRYANHSGGTKFYEVIWAHSGSDSCLIQRWGPVGKYGQIKHTYWTGNRSAAVYEASKIIKAKEKKGYEFGPQVSKDPADDLALSEALRLWHGHAVNPDVYHEIARLFDAPGGESDPPPVSSKTRAESKPELVRDDTLWGSW